MLKVNVITWREINQLTYATSQYKFRIKYASCSLLYTSFSIEWLNRFSAETVRQITH